MTKTTAAATEELIRLLQNAYSGELAAYYAYEGHQLSVRDAVEKSEIIKIRDEEWEHRETVGRMLAELGTTGRPRREFLMKCVGLMIGFLCRIGGWLIPMYGAAKLENGNIVEYDVAAELATTAGKPHFVPALLHMADVEWEHELYFRNKFLSHPLACLLPKWKAPPARPSRAANKITS